MTSVATELAALVEGAAAREKWPLARLVRVFEDTRPEAIAERVRAMELLEAAGRTACATVYGFTGTPGTGKSTLLGAVARNLVAADDALSVAVLAVDPSSERSGGAMLGDRTRVRFPVGESRLYFRSQASDRELGGIGRATFPVVRLLERLFDMVLIETVGIGQSEVEVERVADRVYLVLQPLAGDQIQFMKAGIMEVPHAFVLNKSDAGDAAQRTYHALRASIDFVRPGDETPPPIFRTSATTGDGLDTLVQDVLAHRAPRDAAGVLARDPYFLEKWVRDEYGRFGLDLLAMQGGAEALLASGGTFEAAQALYAPPVAGAS